jgi:Zn-dependent protease with chaperone function
MNDRASFRQWLQALGLVLVGHFWVTLPATFLVGGIALGLLSLLTWFFGVLAGPLFWLVYGLGIMLGCAAGWLWWSFFIPRWRRWARSRSVPIDKVEALATLTGLVWPKGWIFEKTEFKLPDENVP